MGNLFQSFLQSNPYATCNYVLCIDFQEILIFFLHFQLSMYLGVMVKTILQKGNYLAP